MPATLRASRHGARALVVLAAVLAFALLSAVTTAHEASAAEQSLPVSGALEDGGTFDGTVTDLHATEVDGEPAISGVLEGTATRADGTTEAVTQSFTAPTALQVEDGCQILFLDLGPIFLDVLGLQVDLSEIVLDITAVAGAGNLLGNLLCAVAGLLDGPLLGGLLGQLVDILNQIFGIFGVGA